MNRIKYASLATMVLVAFSPTSSFASPKYTNSFDSTARIDGGMAGSDAVFTATATAANTSPKTLVDLEIYNQSNQKVMQMFTTTDLAPSKACTWYGLASLPPGQYRIKVGLFAANWARLYHWNDNAGNWTIAYGHNIHPSAPYSHPQTACL